MLAATEARRTILILAAVACLAGCTAGSPSIAPQHFIGDATSPVAVRPDAQHYEDDVFTSQPSADDATVYERKGTSLTPVETLSYGIAAPQGTVATPSGVWYLTNAGNSNVLIYKTTKKGPKFIGKLDDTGEIPVNIDVTADQDLVAVSNGTSASSGTGSVSVYLNGASQSSRVLTYGNDLLQGQGVAIDPQGNCFWAFDDESFASAPGSIVEFGGCSGTGTLVISGITSAAGMTFDRYGNLYYIDEANGIYKCEITSDCKRFARGFGLPVNLNFDAKEKNLWVADATGYIYALDPKSGHIESKTVSIDGDPYGIAPAPGD
jgi:hypothetical protein